MNLLFNNLYFYLFLILFIIYFIIKTLLLSKQNFISNLEFNIYIHKYLKNNNIIFTFFILFFYVFLINLPLFLFRYNRLNVSYDINSISSIKIEQIIVLLFFALSFTYFFKTLNLIIYEYILKIHYYLHHKYKKYHDFVENNMFLKEQVLFKYCTDFLCFFHKLVQTKKDFMHFYKNLRGLFPKDKESLEEFKKEWLFYLYLRHLAKNYVIIKIIIKLLYAFFRLLNFHISRFIYYIPYSLVGISLGIDIISGTIYYTFYALLYLYITNIIKKIRKFYYDKDPVYDNILSSYFYNNEDEYNRLKIARENNDFLEIFKVKRSSKAISNYLYNEEFLMEYIEDDFKVYYVTDFTRANNEKYIMNIYKRLHVIILLTLFNFYMLYYNKYILVILDMEINLVTITITILGIIYYIHRQIAEALPTHWIEHKKAKICFRILIFFYIIASFYLFLINKFDANFIEILFSYRDIIFIKENPTMNEKYVYLNYYIESLKNDNNVNSEILDKILENIKNKNSITSIMTLEDIRNMVQKFYEEMKNSLVLDSKLGFFEKIKLKLKNIW